MSSFIAFDNNVEVNGQTILSIIKAMKGYEVIAQQYLKKFGIINLKINNWYSQQSFLNVFKEIKENLGDKTLMIIGKNIPDNAKFPKITNLKDALNLLNEAYHINHRGGEIGYYKLLEYNEAENFAIMECKNPYPSNFDEGIIIALSNKYKPKDAIVINVELDGNKPSRLHGADSCTYNIKWIKKHTL